MLDATYGLEDLEVIVVSVTISAVEVIPDDVVEVVEGEGVMNKWVGVAKTISLKHAISKNLLYTSDAHLKEDCIMAGQKDTPFSR